MAEFEFAAAEGQQSWDAIGRPIPVTEIDSVRLVAHNTHDRALSLGTPRIAEASAPLRPVARLLSAEHYSEIEVVPGENPSTVWLPLPASHATQIPISVEVRTTPSTAAVSTRFVSHGSTNWGIEFEFPPELRGTVTLEWKGVVLTRELLPSERSHFYGAGESPARWLAATATADTEASDVRRVAQQLRVRGANTPTTQLEFVLAWTSSELEASTVGAPPGPHNGQTDATSILRYADASCTGYSNVANALFRSLGVPARQVAGIIVGEAMMTHSVNEVFLGPELGWRRVEPQSPDRALPEGYLFVLRVVSPDDEGLPSMDSGRWAAPGVPRFTLIENLINPQRLRLVEETDHFEGCPRCDNRADLVAVLEDQGNETIDELFVMAQRRWQDARERLIEGQSPTAVFGDADLAGVRSLSQLGEVLHADPVAR